MAVVPTPMLELLVDLVVEDHIVNLVDLRSIHQMDLILDLQFTEIMVTLDQVVNNLVLVEVLVELVRQHHTQEKLVEQDYKFQNLLYLGCQQCLMVQVLVIGLEVVDLIKVQGPTNKGHHRVLQDILNQAEQTLEMVVEDNHLQLLEDQVLL
jgi:hypothetical protein